MKHRYILEERQRNANKLFEQKRRNQETSTAIENLNSMKLEELTHEEMNRLKDENERAVVLEKEMNLISEKQNHLDMLRDERRSTIANYIKAQNNRDRSDAKVQNLELYPEAYK